MAIVHNYSQHICILYRVNYLNIKNNRITIWITKHKKNPGQINFWYKILFSIVNTYSKQLLFKNLPFSAHYIVAGFLSE